MLVTSIITFSAGLLTGALLVTPLVMMCMAAHLDRDVDVSDWDDLSEY